MSMSTTIGLTREATRAFELRYGALIINDDLTTAIDELFDLPYERRDAVITTLLELYPEVTREEVDEVLAPFGGADADVALKRVIELFSDREKPLDLHLSEHLIDAGPATLHSVLTDYGNGEVAIEHHESELALLAALRTRAADIVTNGGGTLPEDFFYASDEEECVRIIADFIAPTNGHLHIVAAARQTVPSGYLGYYASEG